MFLLMQMLYSYYALIRKFTYISHLKVYNLTINIRAIKVLIASHISFSLKAVNRFIKDKSKFYFEVYILTKLIHIR